jgi:hypothetical protein
MVITEWIEAIEFYSEYTIYEYQEFLSAALVTAVTTTDTPLLKHCSSCHCSGELEKCATCN